VVRHARSWSALRYSQATGFSCCAGLLEEGLCSAPYACSRPVLALTLLNNTPVREGGSAHDDASICEVAEPGSTHANAPTSTPCSTHGEGAMDAPATLSVQGYEEAQYRAWLRAEVRALLIPSL